MSSSRVMRIKGGGRGVSVFRFRYAVGVSVREKGTVKARGFRFSLTETLACRNTSFRCCGCAARCFGGSVREKGRRLGSGLSLFSY